MGEFRGLWCTHHSRKPISSPLIRGMTHHDALTYHGAHRHHQGPGSMACAGIMAADQDDRIFVRVNFKFGALSQPPRKSQPTSSHSQAASTA
jgi:hypothetical protein